MTWGNSCHRLPGIRSHADAESFFNSVAPVRSDTWSANQRPLGRRSDSSKRIARNGEGPGTIYEMMLYRTTLVSYHPNGHIFITPCGSQMSRDFIAALTPNGLSAVAHSGQIMIQADTPDGRAWYATDGSPLEFTLCGLHKWRLVSEPKPRIRERLCRERAALVRKTAKPFLAWVQATHALCGDTGTSRRMLVYPNNFDDLKNVELWPEFAPAAIDRSAWIQGAYDAFGAREDVQIDHYHPLRRGRHSKYS